MMYMISFYNTHLYHIKLSLKLSITISVKKKSKTSPHVMCCTTTSFVNANEIRCTSRTLLQAEMMIDILQALDVFLFLVSKKFGETISSYAAC